MIVTESQEKLIKEYLKYKVDDPLKYEEFKYPLNEWDNIPPILPRFILTMNRHLIAIVHAWSEKFKEETTIDLRKDIQSKLNDIHAKIDNILEKQESVNTRVSNTIINIDK